MTNTNIPDPMTDLSPALRSVVLPYTHQDFAVDVDVSDLAQGSRLADLRAFSDRVAQLRHGASPAERKLYKQGHVIDAVRLFRGRTGLPIAQALSAVAVGWHGGVW
jgi:hypothetical protein